MKLAIIVVSLTLCASAHAWNLAAGLGAYGAANQGMQKQQCMQSCNQGDGQCYQGCAMAYQEPQRQPVYQQPQEQPHYDYSCISRCANDGRATPYQFCQRQCQY